MGFEMLGIIKKPPINVSFYSEVAFKAAKTNFLCTEPFHLLIGNIEIGVNLLDVIRIFKPLH